MVSKKTRGRKADPSSQSGKVRNLLGSGMSAAEIAKKVGCTVALVYNIKSKAAGRTKTKRGRNPAAAGTIASSDLGAILTAVKNADNERTQMRAALEKIRTLIDEALS